MLWSLAPEREIKTIVRREVSGDYVDRATVRAFVEIEPGKFHHPRVTAVETDVTFLNSLIVDLKIDRDVIAWRVAEVTDVDHDVIEILLAKHDAASFNIRDRDVGWRVVAADVERRELRVV